MYKVVDKQLTVLDSTYSGYASSYQQLAEITFFCFVAFQVLTLTALRRHLIRSMRQDVMQSRGILNIIPEKLFQDHQEAVGRVIKMMKK